MIAESRSLYAFTTLDCAFRYNVYSANATLIFGKKFRVGGIGWLNPPTLFQLAGSDHQRPDQIDC